MSTAGNVALAVITVTGLAKDSPQFHIYVAFSMKALCL